MEQVLIGKLGNPACDGTLLINMAMKFLALAAVLGQSCAANTTASWLAKRAALINDVFGYGVGVLPTKSVPDEVLTWPEACQGSSRALQALRETQSLASRPQSWARPQSPRLRPASQDRAPAWARR